MTLDRASHWDQVHASRAPDEVSWYQEHPERSLEIIRSTAGAASTPIIDVGGGASRLVDLLIDAGYTDLTVLDIAAVALDHARQRLGRAAHAVDWIVADVLAYRPDRRFDVWHDRAVFHFLIDSEDREAYRASLAASIPPGGHVVVAAFTADGPDECSGLPVVRYSSTLLTEALAPVCSPLGFDHEVHVTPEGRTQHFLYGHFRRVPFDG
ncbi:MAG: class I SAM-dependent methyltransferase [Acidimicrobiia bacterium]|nr:class I SAM-dependent methyltransferase [Acidimicrobiia bacterium]